MTIHKNLILIGCLLLAYSTQAQTYTSYLTGNAQDVQTSPSGGICLMGGATENDEAMRWFLRRANGGDVLVLRASGADGYNNYFYSQLGISINSVETIVFNQATAAQDIYIQQKISQAEAIWLAGGNQANYVNYWRNTAIDSLINIAVKDRNIVVGGTSAGMAVQGGFYFTAQNGTVSSAQALQNPYNNLVTVDSTRFLRNPFLENTITDTHFDNPDRKGRLMSFLARIWTDYHQRATAIACDEYTAVCVDTNGQAAVYGDYPSSDDNAYFIQTNCELPQASPEVCSPAQPLEWNLSQLALKVYTVKGTNNGAYGFDIASWRTGTGGEWSHWYADNGVWGETPAFGLNCAISNLEHRAAAAFIQIFPNPSSHFFAVRSPQTVIQSLHLYSLTGQLLAQFFVLNTHFAELDLSLFPQGAYYLQIQTAIPTTGRIIHKN